MKIVNSIFFSLCCFSEKAEEITVDIAFKTPHDSKNYTVILSEKNNYQGTCYMQENQTINMHVLKAANKSCLSKIVIKHPNIGRESYTITAPWSVPTTLCWFAAHHQNSMYSLTVVTKKGTCK